MNSITAYKTEIIDTDISKVRYLFESRGEKSIIKAIEYSFVRKLTGRKIYNLGFGDYDEQNSSILDDVNSNNGDMRKVFNTVLNTVPKFFTINKDAAILIQGSDSAEDFKVKCEISCKKKCAEMCKNYNRRIKAYRYYVDKNFIELSKEYIFFGLTSSENPSIIQYVPKNEYVGILVFKKK